MKIKLYILSFAMLAFATTSCDNSEEENSEEIEGEELVIENDEVVEYRAEITPLNTEITGSETTGTAKFVVENGEMTVTIDVQGAPANIEHWQHFHGFIDGSEATCVTEELDKNEDGILDVVETEPVSGTTMVPFNKLPSAMDLGDSTYPVADEDGNYHYETIVKMEDLEKAFADAFEGGNVDLDQRVFYIHGVPEDTKLPSSVQSVHDIPAHVTLPIACGKIVKL